MGGRPWAVGRVIGPSSPVGAGRTLVVVPALNERASLPSVIAEVRWTLPDVDVLVVDDGSTDETPLVAERAGAWVLRLPYHLGVGGAMRAGFRFALRHGYANVIQIDADGQHDPAEVPRLLDGLADADVVVGARFAGRGTYEVEGARRIAMNVLSRLVSARVGTHLDDVTSGFRAAGPRAIPLFAEHYPVEYLGDTLESLIIAASAGLRVGQVPVAMRDRSGGRPSQSTSRALAYVARALLVIVLAAIRPGAGQRRLST